jgi:NADPH2:quinone reductase
MTRPGLHDDVATRDELLERADAGLGMVARGELGVRIHARYPLERAAEAHRALQGGTTVGKLLLRIGANADILYDAPSRPASGPGGSRRRTREVERTPKEDT